MNWKIETTLDKFKPIAVEKRGLIGYSNGALYLASFDLNKLFKIVDIPSHSIRYLLGNSFRTIDRVLRTSPSCAVLFGNHLYLSRRSEIWKIDILNGRIELDFTIPCERKVLSVSVIEDKDNCPHLVFGEYFNNPERKPVNVWSKALTSNKWRVSYRFEQGEIEHIHSVQQVNKSLCILAGDFQDAAKLLFFNDFFSSKCSNLLEGSQLYRAVWMKGLNNVVYYATDSQIDKNFLCSLDSIESKPLVTKVCEIDGSSIYSGSGSDSIFFSTTVECGLPTGNLVHDLLERKRGSGILSDYSCIYEITNNHVDKLEFSFRKDAIPFRLGQFGSIQFPTGTMPDNHIIAYGTALSGYDNRAILFRR
jgi:hypothetical protein